MSDRREFFRKMTAAGLLTQFPVILGSGAALAAPALPQGIYRIDGRIDVNGKPAHVGQVIRPGDTVASGKNAEVIYVIGQDAFLQRDNSTVEFIGESVLSGLRIVSGKLLSVFGKGRKRIQTSTAVIGIRGTGCYIEAETGRMYFCLCYGEADFIPAIAPEKAQRLATRHHESPVWISGEDRERPISSAPMINHTDAELALLEGLVNRVPPQASSY